jgi:hypothetical protein
VKVRIPLKSEVGKKGGNGPSPLLKQATMKKIILLSMMAFGTLGHAQSFSWVRQFEGNNRKDIERDAAGNMYMIADYLDYHCGSDHYQSSTSQSFISKYDVNDTCLWVKQLPASHSETALDENGNLYVTGIFSGTVDFTGNLLTSRGSDDVYLAKFNSNGDLQWVQQAGGPEADAVSDITALNGIVYITGDFGNSIQIGTSIFTESNTSSTRNFYLAKFTTAGVFSWLKQATTRGDTFGWDLGCDNSGNAYVIVSIGDTTNFGSFRVDHDGSPANNRAFVKYNSAGGEQWAMNRGSNYRLESHNLVTDKNGNSYVVWGIMYVPLNMEKLDPNGQLQWNVSFGASYGSSCADMKVNNLGNVFLTGNIWPDGDFGNTFSFPSSPNGRMYTAEISSSGTFKWVIAAQSADEPSGANSEAIAVSANSKVYVMGNVVGGSGIVYFGTHTVNMANGNAFLARIDSTSVTGMNEPMASNDVRIELHPNPSTGIFTLDLCMDNLKGQVMTIEIVNSLGQVVYTRQQEILDKCISETIALEGLPAGMYTLNAISRTRTESKQLLFSY